jgi:HTH-type transcriptional regulator/antitoxin HipB
MYENSFIESLAGIVTYHRKKNKLTRIELAKQAGVGKTILFDIEHGKKTIRIDTLVKILNALDIKVELTGPYMQECCAQDSNTANQV